MSFSTDELSKSRHMLHRNLPDQSSKVSLAESLADAPMDAVARVIGHHYGVPHTSPPPSPCTHPLLNKPQARQEYVRGMMPVLKEPAKDDTGDSVLTAARKKALLMTSSSSPLFRPTITLSIDSSGSLVSPAQLYTKSLRVREATAIEAAADHRYVQEWGFWLKCYSEGRFNLSRPPDPPPSKPDFTHLSAPPPPDEIDRIKAFKRMSTAYPDWALKNARHLVVLAMRTLQTEHAALSFFDRRNEVMRAECGYNRAVIPRQESIGAHLLVSNDTMVILDTLKDWRLKGSPLVQDVPFIRFYAAAPLVTPEGHVFGAFAVFDPKPKDSFPLRLRQKLTNYARMAIADFRKVMDDDHMSEQSPSGSNYRRIVDEEFPTTQNSPGTSDYARSNTSHWRDPGFSLDSDMAQTQLTKQISAMSLGSSREYARPVDGFSSGGQADFADVPKSVAPGHVLSNLTNQTYNITPAFQRPTPRRIQPSLDRVLATAKLPTPPDTPTLPQHISREGSDDRSDILSSRDKVIPAQPDPEVIKRTPEGADLPQPKSPTHREDVEPVPATSQITPPISQHGHSTQLSGSAEAAKVISLMAQTLGWDFIYVLRILPGYPKGGEVSRGEYDKSFSQLVVAHGCPDPPLTFCYPLHLRALRSAGGLIYRDNAEDESSNKRVGFKVGVMLPLLRDTVVSQPSPAKDDISVKSHDSDETLKGKESCESGLVLGAFRKASDYQPSLEDIGALKESGNNLRSVLGSIM